MGGSSSTEQTPPSPTLVEQWRTVSWGNNQEDLQYVRRYKPENSGIKHLRVLLYGPVGAGKSTFINSVKSILQGRPAIPAAASAITATRSFTKKYQTHKIKEGRGSSATVYPVVFNDIMGLEEGTNCGVHPEDIKLAMMGHVKEGHLFNPLAPLTEKDPDYNQTPSADDKIHVLVCLLSANASEIKESVLDKMNNVREMANDLGIPHIMIITKVDEACPETEKNLRNVYKSNYLKRKMKEFSSKVGITVNCIFPVKNYSHEIHLNEDVDTLILSVLKQIIDFGDDFIEQL
ncbi:interferon-induced protein 44-like [Pelmatolapia mariae]|uniref:interferon-induced protein 44-like n=1 Tax=Pelmatolapia mariae TaxID=158779 RepID=UPI002FE57998